MGRSLDQLTKKKSPSPQSRCLLSAQARCTEVQGKHICGIAAAPAAAVSRHSPTPAPIFFILPTWIRLEQR